MSCIAAIDLTIQERQARSAYSLFQIGECDHSMSNSILTSYLLSSKTMGLNIIVLKCFFNYRLQARMDFSSSIKIET